MYYTVQSFGTVTFYPSNPRENTNKGKYCRELYLYDSYNRITDLKKI